MTIDINELRPAVEAAGLNAISMQEVLELLDRLEAAEKRTAKLEERCAVLTDSLRLAVRQNNHDMLMTAEELRSCEVTLEKSK